MARRWRERWRHLRAGSDRPGTPGPGGGGTAPPGAEGPRGPEDAAKQQGPAWVVGPPRRSRDGDWHGVTWAVAGQDVTFELLDHPPSDRVEAILTAYVPSALAAGATLVTDRPVDAGWIDGVGRAAALMASWWDHAPTAPVRGPGPAGAGPATTAAGQDASDHDPAERGGALCFTAGVDSFWALRHGGHRPTHLLYVVGYDIDRDDTERVAGQMGAVRAVADTLGLTPLFVRTDLRAQPTVTAAHWGRDHGAAIAAAGLVASTVVDRLVIPPSYANDRLVPWGSRPDLDPLWSVPGTLAVEHSATDLPRFDRVRALAADPLAQQNLRVCWEHLTPEANCGRCEKCVRTMAMVATTPHLGAFATLPGRDHLADRIRALHPLPDHHVRMWRDLRDTGLPADVAAAVDLVTAEDPPA